MFPPDDKWLGNDYGHTRFADDVDTRISEPEAAKNSKDEELSKG